MPLPYGAWILLRGYYKYGVPNGHSPVSISSTPSQRSTTPITPHKIPAIVTKKRRWRLPGQFCWASFSHYGEQPPIPPANRHRHPRNLYGAADDDAAAAAFLRRDWKILTVVFLLLFFLPCW